MRTTAGVAPTHDFVPPTDRAVKDSTFASVYLYPSSVNLKVFLYKMLLFQSIHAA